MAVGIFLWAILRDVVSLVPVAAVPIHRDLLLQDVADDATPILPIPTVLQQVLPIRMKAPPVLIILRVLLVFLRLFPVPVHSHPL